MNRRWQAWLPASLRLTPVAQLAEQPSPKRQVGGSKPSRRVKFGGSKNMPNVTKNPEGKCRGPGAEDPKDRASPNGWVPAPSAQRTNSVCATKGLPQYPSSSEEGPAHTDDARRGGRPGRDIFTIYKSGQGYGRGMGTADRGPAARRPHHWLPLAAVARSPNPRHYALESRHRQLPYRRRASHARNRPRP